MWNGERNRALAATAHGNATVWCVQRRAHVSPSFFLSFPVPQTGCGNAASEPGDGRGMKEEHVIVLEGSFCTVVRQGCEQQQPSEGSSI